MSIFQSYRKGQTPIRSSAETQKSLKHLDLCTPTNNSRAKRSSLANYNAKRNTVLEDALIVGLIRFPAG